MRRSAVRISRIFAALIVAALAGAGQTGRAGPIEYITPSGSTTSGGPVSAEAFFTLDNGSISLTLTNLLKNPTDDAQLISGITFDVSGASGSGGLTTVNSGEISTISADGSYTAGVADPLARWTATEAGALIDLTTLTGGKPNRLIIGPDSSGGFTQQGSYSNANSSIIQHNPSVLGTATFEITIPGVTSASTISDVVFQFGTEADCSNQVTGRIVSVPEPSSLALAGSAGLVGLALLWRPRRATGVA